MLDLKRYKPQRLPGHTKWVVRDTAAGDFVRDPAKPGHVLHLSNQGKAFARAMMLERASQSST